VSRFLPALLLVAALVTGCELLARRDGPYPDACAGLGFTEVRCRAIVSRAAELAGTSMDQVQSARFVAKEPEPGVMLGGGRIAVVALTLAGGEERVQEIRCVGISGDADRVCREDPQIGVSGGVDHDVPCTGEAPVGCATPPPTPRPASVAAARPLDIDALDIPLDHVGKYVVLVGDAGLPDGYLSERRAALADARPTAFWINDGIRLEVRPTQPGRPPVGSIYREAYDGVEPVRVFLEFEVVETSPGAVLEVRDILVR
jgi:hypothetical protein